MLITRQLSDSRGERLQIGGFGHVDHNAVEILVLVILVAVVM